MDTANIAVRLAQYLTLAPLFGLAVFAFYARPAAALAAGRPGLTVLGMAALAASLVSILVLAAQMTGGVAGALDLSTLWAVISGAEAGRAWVVRLAALALSLLAIRMRRPAWLAGASGAALASLAWTGHAAAQTDLFGYVRLTSDILHLLAAGIWIGALAAFVVLVARRADPAVTARALARFSGIGTGVVAVLVVTGLINLAPSVAWTPLPVLGTSLWGQLLLLKLVLFAIMLALAGANRFLLTPRLLAHPEERQGHLRLSVGAEFSLGIGVLGLVAWLGTLSPPSMT